MKETVPVTRDGFLIHQGPWLLLLNRQVFLLTALSHRHSLRL